MPLSSGFTVTPAVSRSMKSGYFVEKYISPELSPELFAQSTIASATVFSSAPKLVTLSSSPAKEISFSNSCFDMKRSIAVLKMSFSVFERSFSPRISLATLRAFA